MHLSDANASVCVHFPPERMVWPNGITGVGHYTGSLSKVAHVVSKSTQPQVKSDTDTNLAITVILTL